MSKSRRKYNIAIEISPLLTASGGFGDKSGVFRYMYGLLTHLITELKKLDPKVKIVLFTFAPHNLKYSVTPDLLNLVDDKNVYLFGYTEFLDTTVPVYNKIFDLLDLRILKKLIKIIDNMFSLRNAYANYASKRGFKQYVKVLKKNFAELNVKTIFHSETGFFYLHGFVNAITVYDLTPILFPELHRKATVDLHSRKIRFAKNSAELIIAISESTRRDLLAHSTDFLKKPIVVAYPGLDSSFLIKKHVAITTPKPKNYLLFYSTFEPRKNIPYLVRAFTELYENNEIPTGYKLILIGGKGWGKIKERVIGYIAEQYPDPTKRPIIILDYVTDETLRSYIRGAKAVIYPSLYEGFGLPVLESMALGTPVLTSDTSSLREVGGEAAFYINPKNYQDLKAKLKFLTKNKKQLDLMSKKGLKQSRKFTWKKSAEKVIRAIEDVEITDSN